ARGRGHHTLIPELRGAPKDLTQPPTHLGQPIAHSAAHFLKLLSKFILVRGKLSPLGRRSLLLPRGRGKWLLIWLWNALPVLWWDVLPILRGNLLPIVGHVLLLTLQCLSPGSLLLRGDRP